MSNITSAASKRRIAETRRPAPSREDICALGSDLMRGDGLRVVSAWRHMPSVRPSLVAFERVYELVRADVGEERVRGECGAWVCKPYVHLFRSLGEQWPLEALRLYLQLMGVRESEAKQVWDRAVARYEAMTSLAH